jgi:tetratricopeptide (TPR) repeat protein
VSKTAAVDTTTGSRIPTRLSFPRDLVQPFTLTPTHRGGRMARKGYDFQDWWIAYRLLGSLSESDELAHARIEGVEDLDLILRREESWIEQYIQVKSKEEGTGNWTLRALEHEILPRFYKLFKDFRATPHDASRRIELLLVVEGDLAKQVLELKQTGRTAKEFVFSLITSIDIVNTSPVYKPAIQIVRDFLSKWAPQLLAGPDTEQISWDELFEGIAQQVTLAKDDVRKNVQNAAAQTSALLDEFVDALEFQSRAPGVELLREAAIKRLMAAVDIGVRESQNALDRLVQAIANESTKPTPSPVDRDILLSWLELKPKPPLRTKPEVVSEYVERKEFTEQFSKILTEHRFILLYGLSKIGKSQFVSRYIDLFNCDPYFWFAFSGESDDSARLIRQMAVFIGNATSSWQLADEAEAGFIDRSHFFERVSSLSLQKVFVVLDDAHKADPMLIGLLNAALIRWDESKLLLLSESKIPEVETIGAQQVPFSGLNASEAVQFIRAHGIDPRNAWLEIISMSIKCDGHPLMLRAICQELPPQPSPNDVKSVSDTLPSVTSAKAFLDALSNQLFYRVLKTSEQRSLLSRLAVLPGRFDWGVARSVAAVQPKLSITPSDWRYMKSIVLDEVDVDHCSIPQLLKEIAKTSLSPDTSQSQVLVSAAHAQLKPGGTAKVSFLDFHWAILSLVLAEEYRQAALFFTISVPRLMDFARFQDLSVLFMIFTGEPFQQKLQDGYLKWQLLGAELMFRAKDREASEDENVYKLLARMRLLAHKQRKRWIFRVAIANLVTLIRSRRISSSTKPSERAVRKVFAPITFALRLTLDNGDTETGLEQIDLPLKSYKAFSHVARLRDLDLLKDVVLALRTIGKRSLPDNVLADIYATIAVNTRDVESARRVFHEHSQAYAKANHLGGYFASQYALAHLLHERDGNYAAAREVLEPVRQSVQYPQVLKYRAIMSIGDAWFAEKNFDKSAECYTQALTGHYVRSFRRHIQERLVDSLSRAGNSNEAFDRTVSILRRRRRALSLDEKGHLYARLAFTSVERKRFAQAAIACCGLRRLAESTSSDQYHWLCLYLASWTVKQIGVHDDLLTPPQDVGFRDICALSESVPAEFLKEWRENDKANVKAVIQISAIFELEKRYKRALAQLEKAKGILVKTLPPNALLHFVLNSKMARLHLLLGHGVDAANEMREVIAYQISEKKFPIEVAGLLSCTLLNTALPETTDEGFQAFAESLARQCTAWPQARAAILFWYAQGLLNRLLVQKGRILMRDAEEAAQESNAFQISRMVFEERLFRRAPQFYGVFRQTAWIADIISATLTLSSNAFPDDTRVTFAKTFRDLCSRNQKMMDIAEGVFAENQSVVDKYPFEVLCLALLKTGRALNLSKDPLGQLEELLGKKGPFLSRQ